MRRVPVRVVLVGGAILVFALALGIAFRARRPDILSQGTIAFVSACFTALVAFATLIVLRSRPTSGPRPVALDLVVLVFLAWSWASYLLSPVHRGPAALAFLPVAGFALYLLVRAAGAGIIGPRRILLAWFFIGLAMAQAARGFSQLLLGQEMKGFFFNTNHLAMFLAMSVPAALALAWSARTGAGRVLAWAATLLFLLSIILSGCRSALAAAVIALGLMVLIHARIGKGLRRSGLAILGTAAFVLVALLALSTKPASTVGRILTWKVSARILLTRPFLGTGFATFPWHYNRAQGQFFGAGLGSSAERLSAGPGLYAFNDFLETAVELGIPGLALLVLLWVLIVRSGFAVLRRAGPAPWGDDLDLAAVSTLAVYFILSLFYYPSRILPIPLIFSACLGWLANLRTREAPAPEDRGGGKREPARSVPAREFKGVAIAAAALAAAVLLLSLALLPTFAGKFAAERTWSQARALDGLGNRTEAIEVCRPLVPRLGDNANFLIFFGRLLTEEGQAAAAAQLLDTTRPAGSSPFVLEKRAQALERLGRLDEAFGCAALASSMLPWRLTPKVLLAEICDLRGDAALASKFAFEALETPTKLRTDEGTARKQKALDIWQRLGRKGPADPGDRLRTALLLPPEYQAPGLAALEAAGENAAELVLAVSLTRPDERPGLAFLLANMPDEDLRTLKARFLVENVDLAYQAWRTLPWAARVPEDVFLNDILAYSVANESRDGWRKEFFVRFVPTAAVNPAVEDAVFHLNLDIVSQFSLTYKERDNRGRILGPSRTIRSGTVSCGEASMLLVYACRAAGIPARIVVLERWAHVRMGHIWVEFYDRGGWHHLPAFDVDQPDKTWMEPFYARLDAADPRQHILGSSFKRTGLHNVFGPSVSFVDVTDAYKH